MALPEDEKKRDELLESLPFEIEGELKSDLATTVQSHTALAK